MNRPALLLAAVLAVPAAAQAPAPVVTPIGHYDTTISGQPIQLPTGPAEVAAAQSTIPAGGVLPAHKHPFQRINFVLEGRVRVTNLDTGAVTDFQAGQLIVETRDQWHKGEALDGKPVRLLSLDLTPPGQGNMVRQARSAASIGPRTTRAVGGEAAIIRRRG